MAGTIDPAKRGECTVGVFCSSITSDGRPILWKNRDVVDFDQRYIYFESYSRDGIFTIPFVADVYRTDTTKAYMGINIAGFAVMNSDSYNLGDSLLNTGITDGTLMRIALETCRSLSDFESILDSTNVVGRRDCWNFGVFDSSGACAMYECSNQNYTRFSPYDIDRRFGGYIIRANFSMSGSDIHVGEERFKNAVRITDERIHRIPVDAEFVLQELARDLHNPYDDPYPLPYYGSQAGGMPGYIYVGGFTIAGMSTSAAAVIRGTARGEDRSLGTMFALLGSPSVSVAFPLWAKAAAVPAWLGNPDGAPMYLLCKERKKRLLDDPDHPYHLNSKLLMADDGSGVYGYTLPLETWGINEADRLLEGWRTMSVESMEVDGEQNRIADAIFNGFQSESAGFLPGDDDRNPSLPGRIAIGNFPNPFNRSTLFFADGVVDGTPIELRIFDTLGRLIEKIDGVSGGGQITWDGRDRFGETASSGVYYYSISAGNFVEYNRMTLLR